MTLGYYYLSKVHEFYGDEKKAGEALKRALGLEPLVERQALIFAQITYAGARQ